MVNGVPVGRGGTRFKDLGKTNYDYAKTVISMARKNGWDIQTLELIPKDLPVIAEASLSKSQVTERNRLIRRIFQRFGSVMTPPIPADLEQLIKSKDQGDWLPWEQEAMEKIGQWRDQIEKIRPEILNELRGALAFEAKG